MSAVTDTTPVASYVRATTLENALEAALRLHGDYEYTAGATDAQVLRRMGLSTKQSVIDLSGIPDLKGLRIAGDVLEIGALITLDKLTSDKMIAERYPIIREAAAAVATPVIRKMATIGGNLLVGNRCTYFNQSKFWRDAAGSCLRDTGDSCLVTGVRNGKCFSRNVSDLAAALIALNAEVVIRNHHKQFAISLHDLYIQDGIQWIRQLDDDGILVQIRIAAPAKVWGFRKLRLRRSLDFTSLTVAACLDAQDHARFCLNGVAMAPILISGKLSDLSLGDLQKQAKTKSKIVNNDLMPDHHRREMLDVYLEDLWRILNGE